MQTTLHLMTQRDQSYGSVRKCCERWKATWAGFFCQKSDERWVFLQKSLVL
jgi:hypothetical protein